MIVPTLLFFGSLGALIAAFVLPGLSDLALIAGPCVLASLALLLRGWKRRSTTPPKWVVVDGSNVMHWKDNTARIETVREVVKHLKDLGYSPGVVFDANAGYLISGRYQHDENLSRLLGLPRDRVMVVPKGTPADPAILQAARGLGARVVSNDRYRDWVEQHPEVKDPNHLIRGDYETGKLRLTLH
jgi:hypothetical protein